MSFLREAALAGVVVFISTVALIAAVILAIMAYTAVSGPPVPQSDFPPSATSAPDQGGADLPSPAQSTGNAEQTPTPPSTPVQSVATATPTAAPKTNPTPVRAIPTSTLGPSNGTGGNAAIVDFSGAWRVVD